MTCADILVKKLDKRALEYGIRYEPEEDSSIADDFTDAQSGVDDDGKFVEVTVSGKLVVIDAEDGSEEVRLQRGGSFLRLDLSELDDFSYFSGMNVKLKCIPASSGSYNAIVKSVIPFEQLPMSIVANEKEFLRVFLAFGPMIQGDSFALLELFLDKVVTSSVSTLILSGPFYNTQTPEKALDQTQQALKLISEKLTSTNTKVLLLPNALNDIVSPPTFPTPALEKGIIGMDLPENFQFLPDPGTVTLNGVTFTLTNSQPIQFLSKLEKYHGNNENRERMAKLCEHLLEQNSVCPVKFPQNSTVINDTQTCKINERPHFFIVPSSKLGVMSKIVQNVVFVNPGRFIFGTKARYTKIDVNIKRAMTNNAGQIGFGQFSAIDHKFIELPKQED